MSFAYSTLFMNQVFQKTKRRYLKRREREEELRKTSCKIILSRQLIIYIGNKTMKSLVIEPILQIYWLLKSNCGRIIE